MKLTYQRAIVSFCPDLTDPNAKSTPLAVVMAARGGEQLFGGVACFPHTLLELDPFSQEVLSAVPDLLRRHLDETFAGAKPDIPLPEILQRLHNSLRNSLHVSKIEPEAKREIPDHDAVRQMMGIMVEALLQSLLDPGPGRSPPLTRAPRPAPEVKLWPVGGACPA